LLADLGGAIFRASIFEGVRMTRDELISDDYLKEQRILHAAPKGYGQRGDKWASVVAELAGTHGLRSVLDYGCGRGSLAAALRPLHDPGSPLRVFSMAEYDPAIAGKDEPPTQVFDLVVCTDVLEHIESAKINAVMQHLASVTGRLIFSVISLVPTNKKLTNGKQAHILLRSIDWWCYQFAEQDFVLSQTIQGRDPKKDHKQFAALWRRSGL
jgi:2-polyprenyl-3-methyl-5-hydroxy-6-metoxy-1,4-benzoquinol methylase